MAVRDLSAFLDDDALELPIDGVTYLIPSPDAKTGLWLTALADLGVAAATGTAIDKDDLGKLKLDNDEEQSFIARVLGSGYDQMVAGGVSWVKIQRASRYAFVYFAIGPEQADAALVSGRLMGEAPAPNRSTRRKAKATAPSTRSRGSIAGTTPRRRPAQG